jgi:hypothetical protein
MGIPELSFALLLIVEGCVGPTNSVQSGGQTCQAQNFSVSIPYEKLEQCEAARRDTFAPNGMQRYVRAVCLATSKSGR